MKIKAILATLFIVLGLMLISSCEEPATTSITVVNHSSETILFLYCSTTTSNWGDDELGWLETIDPNEQFTFYVSPDTVYLKAESDDHIWESQAKTIYAGESYSWELTDKNKYD